MSDYSESSNQHSDVLPISSRLSDFSRLNKPPLELIQDASESADIDDNENENHPLNQIVIQPPQSSASSSKNGIFNFNSMPAGRQRILYDDNPNTNTNTNTNTHRNTDANATHAETDTNTDAQTTASFMNVSRFLPHLFGFLATVSFAIWISGFIEKRFQSYFFIALDCILMLVSVIGLFCCIKYGVIQDQINEMKDQNAIYNHSQLKLTQNRQNLKQHISVMDTTVNELRQNRVLLEREAQKFEHLISELTLIAGNDEKALKIVHKTRKVLKSIKKWILENDRAYLISIYYHCAIQDNDEIMSEEEYIKFLNRLPTKQREKFQKIGSFKTIANEDSFIDMPTFLTLIDKVTEGIDADMSAYL